MKSKKAEVRRKKAQAWDPQYIDGRIEYVAEQLHLAYMKGAFPSDSPNSFPDWKDLANLSGHPLEIEVFGWRMAAFEALCECGDYLIAEIPLSACAIEDTPEVVSVKFRGAVLFQNGHRPDATHPFYASVALGILDSVTEEARFAAPWKTVSLLRTLRQAIRESYMQMMGLDLPPQNASLEQIEEFLGLARVYDKAHHGVETF